MKRSYLKRTPWKPKARGYSWGASTLKRGGRIRVKRDSRLAAWSKAVRERDDFTCQVTGIRDEQRNIAHHIAPRSRRKDLKYVVSNGVTLTPETHQWVHDNPKIASAMGLLNNESREAVRKLENVLEAA